MKPNKLLWIMAAMLFTLSLASCDDDDDGNAGDEPVAVIASFTHELTDFKVKITNASVGADTYAWDFGDGVGTSTDKDPEYTYTAAGKYTITLTASNADNTDDAEVDITIEEVGQDPLTLLTGGSSKTWVLAPEENAVSFGNQAGPWHPDNDAQRWWGNSAAEVEGRTCLFDNKYTFTSTGEYNRDINGELWKEWRVFDAAGGEGCATGTDDLITRLDHDVSAWRNGDFTFAIAEFEADTIFDYTISTTGTGGYIGHYVSGVRASNYNVHDLHEYGILSISEDRLELISWGWGGDAIDNEIAADASDRWYRVNLVPLTE